jgi:TonB family protein
MSPLSDKVKKASAQDLDPGKLLDKGKERKFRSRSIGLVRSHSTLEEIPFSMATSISTGLHVVMPFLLAGLVALILFLVSWLLHINLWDWFKPKEDKKDIEFTLVPDTHAKAPEKAKFFGEHNQEAGGKTDSKKPVEAIEKPAPASPTQSAAPTQQEQKPSPQTTQTQPAPQPQKQQQQQPKKSPMDPPKKQEESQEQPPEPKKPPLKQPKKIEKAPDAVFTPTIPMPKAPDVKGPPTPQFHADSGPIPEKSASSSAPPSGPVSIPMNGAMLSHASGHPGVPRAGSAPGGQTGNPEEGPGKTAGVSVREADFGPYMSELKRRLTRNWRPPRGEQTKRVVLKFEIGRDGRLMNIEVNHTSGEPLADEAAINAVKLSAPFRQLPPEFQGESVPILFTFDYTVYGSNSGAKFDRVPR